MGCGEDGLALLFFPRQGRQKQMGPWQCLGCRIGHVQILWGGTHSEGLSAILVEEGNIFIMLFVKTPDRRLQGHLQVLFEFLATLAICFDWDKLFEKNKLLSVHGTLESVGLACWYLTELLAHCYELEETFQMLLWSLPLPLFGTGKLRKKRGSYKWVWLSHLLLS